MRKKRWLVDWADLETKPAIYHCLSRVVNREFRLGDEEREVFRMFMRMYENFSGCRVLSYCVMSNHFHILLEVPPMPEGGISDGELLRRLGVLNGEKFVKGIADELVAARCEGGLVNGNEVRVREIHDRFTPRMHSLSHFMQGLLIRFTLQGVSTTRCHYKVSTTRCQRNCGIPLTAGVHYKVSEKLWNSFDCRGEFG